MKLLYIFYLLIFFNGAGELMAQEWEIITKVLFQEVEQDTALPDNKLNRKVGSMVVIPSSGDIIAVLNGNHPVYRSENKGKTWKPFTSTHTMGRSYGSFSINVDPVTSRICIFTIAQKKNPTRGLILDKKGNVLTEIDRPKYKHDAWTWGMPAWEKEKPQVILGKEHHAWVVLWLSKDGGNTWEKLDFESRNPGVINNSVFVAGNDDGIYRTADEGQTWQKVSDLKVHGKNPVKYGDDIYWTTEHGVIKSSDEGKTWKLQGASLKDALYGPYFGKNEKWMMVVNREGFFITRNEGKEWLKIAEPFVPLGKKKQKAWEVELMHPTNSYGWDWKNKIIYAGNLGGDIYRLQLDK